MNSPLAINEASQPRFGIGDIKTTMQLAAHRGYRAETSLDHSKTGAEHFSLSAEPTGRILSIRGGVT